MILHLRIDNFKSLVDFSLPPEPRQLGQFTCLIGLNGSGKSTLLQAFDFLGQLMTGRLDDWLATREWKKSELTSRLLVRRPLIEFAVVLFFEQIGKVVWKGAYNSTLLRCTRETVEASGALMLHVADGKFLMPNGQYAKFDFEYQGSVMSIFGYNEKTPELLALKNFMLGLKSLELLSPHLMRKRAKEAADVGVGGEKLSAFLHGYSAAEKKEFLTLLREFYPQVSDWKTQALRAGWKDLTIQESYPAGAPKGIETGARHINDGMLRVISILAQTRTQHSLLLFDEIENGINPELVPKLIEHLLKAKQQIIVTTHSPMILNYLPDDVAREAIILLYRTSEGITRSVRYFDLPSTANKLELLGPGEVFVDTDLTQLAGEAEALRKAR